MPRKSKDEEINVNKKAEKVVKSAKTADAKSTTKSKENGSTKKTTTSSAKKPANGTTKKTTNATTKKATSTAKKTATKKATTSAKKPTKRDTKTVAVPLEYYDLPASYNKTVVKILAQTPSCLFVYWEISEKDKQELQKQYGEFIFQDTKPYLVVINETMNYSFEVEINDYANSWYIHINDSDCKYALKLIRKPISHNVNISVPSVNIISSNEMDAPNDHILFDRLGKTVFFKNVQTNIVSKKDISTLSFISNIGKIYNIYDLYKQIYQNEISGNELRAELSSSQFSSFFK